MTTPKINNVFKLYGILGYFKKSKDPSRAPSLIFAMVSLESLKTRSLLRHLTNVNHNLFIFVNLGNLLYFFICELKLWRKAE
jgi:hypothetical protein